LFKPSTLDDPKVIGLDAAQGTMRRIGAVAERRIQPLLSASAKLPQKFSGNLEPANPAMTATGQTAGR
jgi:hypothetical protein